MAAPRARPIVVPAGGPTDAAPASRDDASADRPAYITAAEETIMTTQGTTQVGQKDRRGIPAQVLMTALTLAVLGALVLWQAWPGGEESTTPATGNTAQSSMTAGAQPLGGSAAREPDPVTARGGMAELYADQAAQARAAVHTVYIVQSQERAQAVRAGLDESNAIRAAQGQPPLNEQVLLFDSTEEVERFKASAESLRSTPDSPPMVVVDLRHRAPPPCPIPEVTSAASASDAC